MHLLLKSVVFALLLSAQTGFACSCGKGVLKYFKHTVVGDVTLNYNDLRWRKVKFLKKINTKWAEKAENRLINREIKYQMIGFRRFNRIMKRKCTRRF